MPTNTSSLTVRRILAPESAFLPSGSKTGQARAKSATRFDIAEIVAGLARWLGQAGQPVLGDEFFVSRSCAHCADRLAWTKRVRATFELNAIGRIYGIYAPDFGITPQDDTAGERLGEAFVCRPIPRRRAG